jgi:hypothetical protein
VFALFIYLFKELGNWNFELCPSGIVEGKENKENLGK